MIRKDLLRLATHLITKVDSVDKNMMENFESANDEKIISTVKKQQRRIEQIMEYMKGAFNDYEGIPKAILEEKRKFNEAMSKYREEDEAIKEALKRGEQMVEIRIPKNSISYIDDINCDGMPLNDIKNTQGFKTKEELEQIEDTPLIIGSNMKEKADELSSESLDECIKKFKEIGGMMMNKENLKPMPVIVSKQMYDYIQEHGGLDKENK